MLKRKIFMLGLMLALAILLVSTTSVFAQVQLAHFDVNFVQPESWVICHSGVGEEKHQDICDDYADASSLELAIDSVIDVENSYVTTRSKAMRAAVKAESHILLERKYYNCKIRKTGAEVAS